MLIELSIDILAGLAPGHSSIPKSMDIPGPYMKWYSWLHILNYLKVIYKIENKVSIMQMVVIIYCLGNKDKKKSSLHVQYRCSSFIEELGIKPRALCTAGKCSTLELHPSS